MIRSHVQLFTGLYRDRRAVSAIECAFIVATAVLIGLANVTMLGSKLGAKFGMVPGFIH